MKINTVVFDLGGVLIDWNPDYVFDKILDQEKKKHFYENICTSDWNDEQDAGRSFEEATKELMRKHPAYSEAIAAWYGRWQETISGPIDGTVSILRDIKASGKFRLFALTNWSAETFPWALENFEFLHWFQGIVVSGIEKCRKPLPEFFHILFNRYDIRPSEALFIDDNLLNIEGANRLGLNTIAFRSPEQLAEELQQWNIKSPTGGGNREMNL